jgi:hypothetical protein
MLDAAFVGTDTIPFFVAETRVLQEIRPGVIQTTDAPMTKAAPERQRRIGQPNSATFNDPFCELVYELPD